MKFSIIQLADLHASISKRTSIERVIKAFFNDLDFLKERFNISPDLIFFTGDLINKGENAEKEFQLSKELLLDPLLKKLKLSTNTLFIVPGNHEVNRKNVSETFENALKDKLKDSKNFSEYFEQLKNEKIDRDILEKKLSEYHNFKKNYPNKYLKSSNYFFDAYKLKYKNSDKLQVTIGIVGFNTAWRSSQFGVDDKRILIGEEVFYEAFDIIKECDLKIAFAHHPLEMFDDWDRKNLKILFSRNFDLLLNGHIHDSEFEYTKPLFGRLYLSTCASLFSGRIESGYSVMEIDLAEKKLTLYLRKWYDKRGEFDDEIDKCKNGVVVYNNFQVSNSEVNELLEISSIKNQLHSVYIDNAIMLPIEDIMNIKLQDIFIEPLLTEVPSYKGFVKQFYPLREILNSKTNIVFYGRKNYGKTTLLKFIANEVLKEGEPYEEKIPLLMNFEEIPKNNYNGILRTIKILLDHNIDIKKIEKLLNNGKFVILLDDYDNINDSDKDKKKKVFLEFFKKFPNCTYILSISEKISLTLNAEYNELKSILKYKEYYIYLLNSGKIRELLRKWKSHKDFNEEQMLKQIVYYCHQLRIPVTPLNVTLFLGVLFRENAKKNVKNEAYLIENYLQSLLEKLNPRDTKVHWDFKEKESFLAYIAYRMYEKNKYEWPVLEFEQEKLNYFSNFGEDLPESEVFDDLYLKGILCKNNSIISFNYRFFFDFFLAKALQNYPEKKMKLLNDKNYLKYSTSLVYKAGLDRNDFELLDEIDKRATKKYQEIHSSIRNRNFDVYKIDNSLIEYSHFLEKEIQNKNSVTYKDEIKDTRYLDYDAEDQKIKDEEIMDDIAELISLSSDILRNTNQIKFDDKKYFLQNNVEDYTILMWKVLEEFHSFIEEVDRTELRDFLDENGKNMNESDIEVMLNSIKDIIYYIVPTSIAYFMSQHLATPKLKNIVNELINESNSESLILFYSVLLLEIDFENAINEITKLIQSTKSIIVDTIIAQYIRIFCNDTHLTDKQVSQIMNILNKIKRKHNANADKLPAFVKNTLTSDLKQDLIRKKK